MDTLTVWTFPTAEGADEAVDRLRSLAEQGRITVDDAAVVSWPASRRKPKVRELGSLTGPGALWGGFWGLLLGLIFLVPLAGLAFGAGAGAVAGGLVDVGIDDAFIKRIRAEVEPGTSAAFVVSRGRGRRRRGRGAARPRRAPAALEPLQGRGGAAARDVRRRRGAAGRA